MSLLLSGEGGCIVAQRPLIEIFGRTPAQFIQQIHYWIQKNAGQEVEGLHWVYNTLEAWAEQLAVAPKTVQRAVYRLKQLGVLLVKNLNPYRVNRTLHYTLDYKRLEELCQKSLQSLSPAPQDISTIKETAIAESQKHLTENPSYRTKCPDASGQNVQIYTKSTYKDTSHKSRNSKEDFKANEKRVGTGKPLPVKLLEIWNGTVGAHVGSSSLTVKRAQWLASAFKHYFQSSMERWKTFCHALTQSDFLLGKVRSSFKASLDWILRFDILQRLKEGQFGVSWKEDNATISSSLELSLPLFEENKHESLEVKNFRECLVKGLGLPIYLSWLQDAEIKIRGQDMLMEFSSSFKKQYIETHHLHKMRSLFKEGNIYLSA